VVLLSLWFVLGGEASPRLEWNGGMVEEDMGVKEGRERKGRGEQMKGEGEGE
jgi:hypothetical protein